MMMLMYDTSAIRTVEPWKKQQVLLLQVGVALAVLFASFAAIGWSTTGQSGVPSTPADDVNVADDSAPCTPQASY